MNSAIALFKALTTHELKSESIRLQQSILLSHVLFALALKCDVFKHELQISFLKCRFYSPQNQFLKIHFLLASLVFSQLLPQD